jgi:hypothetical protein
VIFMSVVQRIAMGRACPMKPGADVGTPAGSTEHALMNYLSIIMGFSDLLLQETAADDPRRADLEEIHRAATAAVILVSAPHPSEV